MRGVVHDLGLGGREFDRLLTEHMCDEVRRNYGIDVRSSRRHYFRLADACEKLRKQMSADTSRLPLNIESFMNDTDISVSSLSTNYLENSISCSYRCSARSLRRWRRRCSSAFAISCGAVSVRQVRAFFYALHFLFLRNGED